MNAITIRSENGQRNVYRGDVYIASIADHRRRSLKDKFSTIQDNWAVLWRTGRVDWHATLSEARANVTKG